MAPPRGARRLLFLLLAPLGAAFVLAQSGFSPSGLDATASGAAVAAFVGAGSLGLLLRAASDREWRAKHRDQLLSRSSTELVSAQDTVAVHTLTAGTLSSLAAGDHAMRATLMVGPPERATQVGDEDAHPYDLRTIVPSEGLATLRAGQPARFSVTGSPGGPKLAPSATEVLAFPLGGRGELRGMVLVTAEDDAQLPSWLVEGVSVLAAEATLALESVARKEQFRLLIENSSDVVAVVDPAGRVRLLSPSVQRIFGYPSERVVGQIVTELVHPDDVYSTTRMLKESIGATEPLRFESRWAHADGTWRESETIVTNRLDDPNVGGLILNTRDISERKALEKELAHRSLHDPLTDLANRSLFHESVERALRRTGRDGRSVAVVFMDVDDFKHVNDSLGHAAGDRMLQAVADRVRLCVRPYDLPARLGGDEFAILLENADERIAAGVAERVLRAMEEPVRVDALEISVHVSLGIAVGAAGDEVDSVLRNADVAMYTAKGRGKARFEIFHPGMQAAALERIEMASELRRAVEEGELVLHYQPIVSLHSGGITGAEALLRWNHPQRGMVSPIEFIPTAEETGLIVPIGRWALQEATRQLRTWHERHGDPPLSVSVNVSVKQLQDPRFVGDVRAALASSGVDPRWLTLEITETVLLSDEEQVLARIEELHDVGVRLAIDDFGTGYASLGYLARFPVNILKVDRSFIEGAGSGTESSLTPVMVSIGRTLGLQTVAEGVETPQQVTHLRELGFDAAQGFLFARPAAAEEMDAVLAVRRLVQDFTTFDTVGR